MVYELVVKIKDIRDPYVFTTNLLEEKISEISSKIENPLDVQISPPDEEPVTEIFIKADVSISSMPRFHEVELETATKTFKLYVDELAKLLHGVVSENESFYHNSKTFSRLYT